MISDACTFRVCDPQLTTSPLLLLCFPALQTQSNISKRAAAGAPEPVRKQEVLESLKAKALELFDQVDTDHNGVMDR